MTSQEPDWRRQPQPAYGQPSYRHAPPPVAPPKRKRRRWLVAIPVLLLVVPALLAGYLYLTYSRSVGAPPIADPVPAQCEMPGELLDQVGTPSWQGGPLRVDGKVRGVTCEWVAAEEENVRLRRLSVTVDRHPSAGSAKKAVSAIAKELGDGTAEQDGVGDQAMVRSVDGVANLVARRGRVVVGLEIAGSDKGFFSGLLGDEASSPVPAAQLRELSIAVAQELFAPTG